MAGRTEFPTFLLPIILPHLHSDDRLALLSLLAVCCVSKDWKAAAEDLPELWTDLRFSEFPERAKKKLTDERLCCILSKSRGLGLTSVDLSRCKYITDETVWFITKRLPRLLSRLSFNCCTGVTWESVIPLAKHVLRLFEEASDPPSKLLETPESMPFIQELCPTHNPAVKLVG